jgi:hypothetical protein
MNNCMLRTYNCPGIKKCLIISLIDPAITPTLFFSNNDYGLIIK